MNTKYEGVTQPLLGANSAESTPYANLILSYFPKGAEITFQEDSYITTVKFGNAIYSGKVNENDMPIGDWDRKEGEKTESVEFRESYTKDKIQYTNVFVVRGNSFFNLFFNLFANPKVILGTLTFSDGDKYEGELKDNKRHGKGTYTFSDGEKYEGEWKDGENHGTGTYTFSNGEKYEGESKDGEEHGTGTYTFSNGDKYEGEWKDNKRHGTGTYTFLDGTKYEGEWKDNKIHGKGIFTFSNGTAYEGEWENDKPHGAGLYKHLDGSSYVIKNVAKHSSIFKKLSSEDRQTYLNDLVTQDGSGVVRYETYEDAKKAYEDAKKAYEAAQNISINQEEELKQSEIQNLNQTLNSSHASQEQSQSQSQQFQASDNEEEKGESSLQKGRLGVENDPMLNPDDIKLDITEGSNTAAQNAKNCGIKCCSIF